LIKQLNHIEISLYYPKLYQACFGKPAPKSLPSIVLISEDENRVYGFSAGFAFNDETMYINSTGMIPQHRTKKRAARLNKQCNQVYKQMGFKHLMGHIENTNKRTIFIALLSGYLITGFRVASDGKQYVIITQNLAKKC